MFLRSLLVSVFLPCLPMITAIGASDTQATDPKQPSPDKVSIYNSLSSMPTAFTMNMGQLPDSILFRASADGATMWFTRDGIYYQCNRRNEKAEASSLMGAVGLTGMPDRFGRI